MTGPDKNLDKNWLSWTTVMLAVMLALFILVLSVTTFDRVRRTNELMQESLALRGNLLVEYLESATRAALRGNGLRVVLLADLAQDMSDYAQLRSLIIMDEQGQVAASLRKDGSMPEELALSLKEEEWQALKDGQSFAGLRGNNLLLGRVFQPFISGRPSGLAAPDESRLPDFRFSRSSLHVYDQPMPGHAERQGRHQAVAPLMLNFDQSAEQQATAQTWENMARLCLAVSRGSGKLFALVELSGQEFHMQSQRDLRSALILAGIIFAGSALLAVALTWLVRHRSREIENMRRTIAENQHMAAVGRLAAAVAHEVRNPLSSLRGLVQLMGKNFASDSKGANYSQVAVDEVDRLERVVSGLLNYSRPRTPRLVELDPGESINAVLDFIQDDPRTKGVAIDCQLPSDLPALPADPDLLRQVLLNLIINALEALNGQGHLWLSAAVEGAYLVVRVKDDGPGLPEAQDVFDPFFSSKPQGSGLGLAIARNIVMAHRGVLEGFNAPEGGAVMEMKMRLKQ